MDTKIYSPSPDADKDRGREACRGGRAWTFSSLATGRRSCRCSHSGYGSLVQLAPPTSWPANRRWSHTIYRSSCPATGKQMHKHTSYCM